MKAPWFVPIVCYFIVKNKIKYIDYRFIVYFLKNKINNYVNNVGSQVDTGYFEPFHVSAGIVRVAAQIIRVAIFKRAQIYWLTISFVNMNVVYGNVALFKLFWLELILLKLIRNFRFTL